jgi:heat shock protein HtpX
MSVYSQQSRNQTSTMLLMFLFVGLVSSIFYGFATITGNGSLAYVGLAISLGQCGVAYFFGDKMALASSGAQKLDENQMLPIHEMVQNLAKIAGIPAPKIFISPDPSPNAFACGRSPKNASICLNQGILDLLNRSELEGVIAHELSHIKNRDILIMTVSMVLASVISFLADFGIRANMFGGRDRDNKNNSPLILVFYVFLMVIAPLLSALIQMAVSRQREFLADATAVTMTRYPQGLQNALSKLYQSPVPSRHYSTAMNHFFISPPKKSWNEKINTFFSTHPSLDERIKALDGM